MGNADWSRELHELGLGGGFPLHAPGTGAAPSSAASALLLRQLEALREEHRGASAAQAERIRELEAEVCALRRTLEEERGRARLELERLVAPRGLPCAPPAELLARPLVLGSPQGDFLGVIDALGQALSLGAFLRLVEEGGPERVVASCWERCAGGWSLAFSVCCPESSGEYALDLLPRLTPSGNKVVLLAAMRAGGKVMERELVLRMFRRLRGVLQED